MSNTQTYIHKRTSWIVILIRCCPDHILYSVPVIFTLKWNPHQYWCPYCGMSYTHTTFFNYYPDSEILKRRVKLFKELSNDYLSGKIDSFMLYQKPDFKSSPE